MKNLTPAELAVVANVDRDRLADDLAALVAIPSLTGDEGAVQTEVALRMTTAGLDVERVDTPAIDLSTDPDFPGVEVARDTPSGRDRAADGRRGRAAGADRRAHRRRLAGATSWPGRRRRFGRGSRTASCTAAAPAT